MKKLLVILFVAIGSFASAQSHDQNILTQLYDKTIENYFNSRVSKTVEHANKPEFLVLKDSIPGNIKLNYKNFTIKIVSDRNAAIEEIEKTSNKLGSFSLISRKFVKDTLDITIGTWGVGIKHHPKIKNWHLVTKEIMLSASCGGTNGYIPSGRMVYREDNKTWNFSSAGDIFLEMKKKNPYL